MRRSLAIILFAVALAACGSSSDTTTTVPVTDKGSAADGWHLSSFPNDVGETCTLASNKYDNNIGFSCTPTWMLTPPTTTFSP